MRTKLSAGLFLALLASCQQPQADADDAALAAAQEAAAETAAPDAASVPRTPTKEAFFGDLHVHTRNSFDASIFGTIATPDDAYRFAKGEAIDNGVGRSLKLRDGALDFYAVTDHGEYLGVLAAMADPSTELSKTATAQAIFGESAENPREAFLRIGRTVVDGEEIEEIYDQAYMNSVWADAVAAADRHNEPGVFTTFAGYEFTANEPYEDVAALNLHRNVIFKSAAPAQIFSTLNSTNPEDLWDWMEEERAAGREVLAIPHNSNVSNGQMFAQVDKAGEPITAAYARQRLANEPVVEITQVKGTSETHPLLAKNDEFADFEIYNYLLGTAERATVEKGGFVRPALGRGLAIARETGANPYEFGFIGSSDTHVGASAVTEDDFFGKFPADVTARSRKSTPPDGASEWPEDADDGETVLLATQEYGASGLAGVWAEANTREDIFEAIRARETFGTSGPRMLVRFFAAQGFEADILSSRTMIADAYGAGVPMGGKIAGSAAGPEFLVWAASDPDSAPLQRLQVIKVTEDSETIHDVACAGGAAPDSDTRRCPDNGAGVDLSTCNLTGDGAGELQALWRDPDWAPETRAAYYVRVLENPKCRWSTWDAVRNGTPPNPAMAATIQDRAWSSAIWVE